MKIEIREKQGKTIKIPIPMWLLKLCSSKMVINFVKKSSNEKDAKHLEMIDFDLFKYNLSELKRYKGLVMVDIQSKDGDKVKITI